MMAFILRSVRFLLNCCCVQIHNAFRGCVSYLPKFSLNSIQFSTTNTKQIAGNITKKGQPKEKMGKKGKKKSNSSGAKNVSVSPQHQSGLKRRPEASPPDQIAAKRTSPSTSTAPFETSNVSPTTLSQTTKPNELSEYQQADQNAPLSAGEIRHVEEKQSEASAEHVKPEVFSTEPQSTEPSSSNLSKKRRRNRKGRKDSQGTDEVKSETLVGKQHEPVSIEKPQQAKQEATPEPIFKVSPTKQKLGDEQRTDSPHKHGEPKDIQHERRHIKDEDVGRNSEGKHPNQQNRKQQVVQQLEGNESIPDSKSADVSQLDVKPIETSPKKSNLKQRNATSQKTTPEKQSKQKPQPEAKGVTITSELLDKILISPEKSRSVEKSKSEDKQSLRPEEVKVQKSDQIQKTTKSSSREKSDERPPREKSSDRPSREKSGDRSSREKSNDRASTPAFMGRLSAEQRIEYRDDNHEARYIPSPQKETQRGEDRGKEQGPTKGERLPDGGQSDQRNWDDDDVMEVPKEDDKEPRSDRDRKQDQPQEPEKQYRNQEDRGFQRVQHGRGGQQRGRGRGRGTDDWLQANLDNWVGGQQGNWRGNRDGHQNQRERDQDNRRGGYQDNQRGNRGGYEGGQREHDQGDWRGGYNRGGQRGGRGRGRGVIVDVPLRQPDVLPPFLKEVEGDLFSCDDHVALAHCVSADFYMNKGIALDFKKRFAGVPELLAQGKSPGNVAFLKRRDRYIYYMVTKSEYFKKPTYKSMGNSLIALKTMVEEHKVTELAMPRIGAGLDRLDWDNVLDMILDTFKDSKVNITVYVYKPPRGK